MPITSEHPTIRELSGQPHEKELLTRDLRRFRARLVLN
jgi:hypothetical protein